MSRGSGLALAAAALATAAASGAAPAGPGELVVAQYPLAVRAGAGSSVAPGAGFGEGGRLVLVSASGRARVLTAGFHSAADPELSFDGRRLLFAAKRAASEPWCVFEMELRGARAPRKVSCGAAGARQPVYLPTVYTLTPTSVEPWVQVAFVGDVPGERDEAGRLAHTSLWSCKTDGGSLRRLSFNLSNDADPAVLPDGRVVYSASLGAGGAGAARTALVGLNADGTDYQLYAGPEGLRVKRMPAPTASGHVVFVETDAAKGDGGGRLAAVSQRRPLHSHRVVSAETGGVYHSPSALADGRLLVSWRADAARGYGVYRLDPATGVREPVFDDPAWHDVQAKAVAPRPPPDARSSVVRDDDPLGTLYTIDVSIQEPGRDLPRARARRLRVVEGVAASEARPATRRLLGEIEIAEDGSYQVQVPANTPVALQLVDAGGAPLRTSGWLWVRNHAVQGCVGCHEDPERAPPNRLMQALRAPAPVLNPPLAERRPLASAPRSPADAWAGLVLWLDPGARP